MHNSIRTQQNPHPCLLPDAEYLWDANVGGHVPSVRLLTMWQVRERTALLRSHVRWARVSCEIANRVIILFKYVSE